MLNINETRLLTDLYFTRNEFIMRPNKNMIKYDYSNFTILNGILANTTGKMFPENKIFKNPCTIQKMLNEFVFKGLDDFIDKTYNNKNLLLKTFKNYSNYLKNIKYVYAYTNENRSYSEKDFKDIILSYFATYGDKTYSIVKKYFDEDRIHFGYIDNFNDHGNFVGFYVYLLWLSTGYILSMYNKYDSWSMTSIAHELGHAIDAEIFKFPQQKTISLFSDLLIEVPSATYEFGMSDYLKKNKIDVSNVLDQYNGRFKMLRDTYLDLKECYGCKNGIVDPSGIFLKPDKTLIKKEDLIEDEEGHKLMLLDPDYLFDSIHEHDDEHYLINLYKKIPFRDDIIYGMGYLFALHLNQIKESSMKDFHKIFNSIITSRKEASLEDSIELLGISVEDFISLKYVKDKIKGETKELKRKIRVN